MASEPCLLGMVRLLSFLVLACGCHGGVATSAGGLRLCPAAGGANCYLFTPAETGLGGEGANTDQLALRPSNDVRGQLLVFLNGSGGTPLAGATGLEQSFYAVARSEGLHVLGVSYRSSVAVGVLCQGNDDCFEPTRRALLTGVFEAGTASPLANVIADEGIEQRVVHALETLTEKDPDGQWAQFVEADGGVAWTNVIAAGHSQGGGHAALLAKLHPLAGTVMLASPCDALADGSPASWLQRSTSWATPVAKLHGLWAPGDSTCPAAPLAWEKLGVPTTNRHVDAVPCSGKAAHSAPLDCTANAATWRAMLAP